MINTIKNLNIEKNNMNINISIGKSIFLNNFGKKEKLKFQLN